MNRSARCYLLTVAVSLSASFVPCAHALTSSDALPSGVRAAAFVYGVAPEVTSAFDANGELESLVSPLNRSVTFEELAEFEPELNRLKNVIDSIYPQNIGNQLLQADLYADAKVHEQRYVPALLWGITDRLSLGTMVPISKRRIEASFDAEVTNQGRKLRELVGQIPALKEAAQQLQNANVNTALFTEKIFAEHGYQTPTNYHKSGLGDVEFETRYLYFRSEMLNMSARANLKFPTGEANADPTNLLDRPFGNGHYALKLGLLQDFRPFGPRWILSSGLFFTHNFEGRERKAVRKSADQLLPDLHDPQQIEMLRKKRGFDLASDVGISRSFFDGVIWIAASYLYTLHAQDRYSGDRSLDYASLSENTRSEEHGVEYSFEVSSIQLFLKEMFPIPGKLVFAWYQPFRGKHAMYTPYGRMDFALLF